MVLIVTSFGVLFSNMESSTLELLQDAEDLEKVSLFTQEGGE